jgi:hypothetical protein
MPPSIIFRKKTIFDVIFIAAFRRIFESKNLRQKRDFQN